MEAIEVSVIIPCLNEEKTVARCIEIAQNAMQRAVILCEDNEEITPTLLAIDTRPQKHPSTHSSNSKIENATESAVVSP